MVDYPWSVIEDAIRQNYYYDKRLKVVLTRPDSYNIIQMPDNLRAARLYRRHIYTQHIAWLLQKGEWPSNFVIRLNGGNLDDSIDNLVEVSDKSKYGILGYAIERRGGYEAYFHISNGHTQTKIYLGKYFTKQDADYRVYAYNVERERTDRSISPNTERNTRTGV